jgi:hypothetical protein
MPRYSITHVAGALDRPLVVLLDHDGSDEAHDGVLVWEDAAAIGATLDLPVETLDRVGAVQLPPTLVPIPKTLTLFISSRL